MVSLPDLANQDRELHKEAVLSADWDPPVGQVEKNRKRKRELPRNKERSRASVLYIDHMD